METVHKIFMDIIVPAISMGLSTLLFYVAHAILKYVHLRRKQLAHETGNHIVEESVLIAIDGMGSELMKALADGTISDVEKRQLKEKAKSIAEERLRALYGFYKKDLTKWINERIDTALPKFARSEAHRFVSKNL